MCKRGIVTFFIIFQLVLIVMVMTAYSSISRAAELRVDSYINTSMIYDDNILFSTTQPKESWGLLAATGISLNRNTEITRASLKGSLFIREYDEPAMIDTVDQHLDINLSRYTERHEVGVQVGRHRDTTVRSEIDSTGPVRVDRRVEKHSLQPYWNYQLSQRDSLQLSYMWTNVDYDALPTEFSDYTYTVWQLGYRRQVSQKTALNIQYSYSEFKVPDIGFAGLPGVESSTTTDSVFIGASHRFTETLSADIQLGRRETEENITFIPIAGQPVITNTSKSTLYVFSLTGEGESNNWVLSVKRDLRPGSFGQLNQTDKAQLKINSKISGRTQLLLDAGYLNSKSSSNTRSFERRHYWVQPGLSYSVDRRITLAASYRYSRQEYDNTNNNSAVSNRILITLNYQWPSIVGK